MFIRQTISKKKLNRYNIIMLQNFLSVFEQVCILYILIFIGFLCGKFKVFTKESIKQLSTFVLYLVTPCVIINAFNRPFEKSMLKGLFITFLTVTILHVFYVLVAHLCLHDKDVNREKVLRFGMVFSNCGFMALPLQQALLGDEGVFYSAAYIAIFNIACWTYGAIMMSHEKNVKITSQEKKSKILHYIKKCFVNPGVIGIAIGLIVFISPVKLPKIIISPIQSLAAFNTPLPMVIIGFYLSEIKNFDVLKKFNFWLDLLLRLVITPLAFIVVIYFCGIRGILLKVMAIACCTPVAANTVMFATIYNRDTTLASELVSISTLFSVITMPIIITFAMSL